LELTKKKVIKTAVLPGLIPRFKDLFGSGFGMIAYLIALVYNTVRILPNNHPYLRTDMIGQFTVLQVIREASNHVRIGRKNIDQVVVFFTILTGIFLFVFQFIVMIFTLMVSQANAQASIPSTVEGFFQTPNQAEDLSFRMLDIVFGVPGIFESKEDIGTAMHQALQAMFQFYSLGMVMVGAIIILYFVVTLVGETARTGIPFGQRSNKTWMAPRVILFFALLLPVANGINGGQYLTLYTAKLGSLLATSGWTVFHEKISEAETVTGKDEENVPIPQTVDLSHIPAFMLVAKTCQKAYETAYNEDYKKLSSKWESNSIKGWTLYKTPPTSPSASATAAPCTGEEIGNHTVAELGSASYPDIAACAKGNVYIIFGVKDEEKFSKYTGGILPTCGSMVMQTTDLSQGGSAEIQDGYLNLIKDLWDGNKDIPTGAQGKSINEYASNFVKRIMNINPDPAAELPGPEYIKGWITHLQEYSELLNTAARERQIEENKIVMTQTIKDYGWVGAPIVYNMVASNAGAFVSSIQSTPRAEKYSKIMEENKEAKLRKNLNPTRPDIYNTIQSAEGVIKEYDLPNEQKISKVLNAAYRYWDGSKFNPEQERSKNILIDTINVVFGTYGLFEICKNTDIHPLAQLSAVGKSMVDSSIAALFATGFSTVIAIIPTEFSPSMNAASSFFGTIAGIGLLIGFILFYVFPFLPFIYFFFATASWLKTIFEAMVAMPLWALAHLRIDGEGIPGEAAIHGYYMLFEIFLRPILIIFGLIAAIIIFSGMVKVLNEVFYLAISNLSGQDPRSNTVCFQAPSGSSQNAVDIAEAKNIELKDAYRGPIDEFFFTILYTIFVFLIGQSCFKLIDAIPKRIMNWFGGEMPSFLDEQGETAEGLLQYVTLGGSQFGEKIASSIGGVGKGVQETVKNFTSQK